MSNSTDNALFLGKQHITLSAKVPFSSNVSNDAEWKIVIKGKKSLKAKNGYPFLKDSEKREKSLISKNKYTVPTSLEKYLHHNSGISAYFASKLGTPNGGTLRCYKRNQRRRKKRAQKHDLSVVKDCHAHKEIKFEEEALPEPNQAQKHTSSVVKDCHAHKEIELEEKSILEPIANTYPEDIWTACILPFLSPKDIISFGCCSKKWKSLSETGHIWKPFFCSRFPSSNLTPISSQEWKLAYKLSTTKVLERLRCSHTKKTFFEDVIGVGIDFTVNPMTKKVDYISTSQDLLSASAFTCSKNRTDVFGNQFKLFLPLYFSEEHFQRSLHLIKNTIVQLCPDKKTTKFHSLMILDVLPKIINTFVVLVSDEGLAASRRSFHGIIRIHRLFLALAHEYPSIKSTAFSRLNNFIVREECRVKSSCPSIGNFLPLLMIVDQKKIQWTDISSTCLSELQDRRVLWVCKAHPHLENLNDSSPDERLKLTLSASSVGIHLTMLIVYFLWLLCKGSTHDRAALYDQFCGCLEAEEILLSNNETKGKEINGNSVKDSNESNVTPHLSFQKFRYQVHRILSVNTWQNYYNFVLVPCPKSKFQMAQILKNAVRNSRKKRYHKTGMNFSAIHASGTSRILAKGQQYSAPDTLHRVEFHDHWSFDSSMFLDATCLMYAGQKRVATIDYQNTSDKFGAVIHSGDVMSEGSGTHTISLDLQRIDPNVTTCIFVLSAWSNATLKDVTSASITFKDADACHDASPLCTYNLEAHNKVSHLKSIIMCKLYRISSSKSWHVLAIGDSHCGSVDNYCPIYHAANSLL